MLLGVASLRAESKLHYDGANMRVTNKRQRPNRIPDRDVPDGYSL